MRKILFAVALLAAPLAARAQGQVGLRLGGAAAIAYHDDSGTHSITSAWPLEGNVMLSYWLPASIISIDVEAAEQFYASPPSGLNSRIGTVIRPGIRIAPPVIPIYLRGAIPLNVENNNSSSSVGREKVDLRVGAGIDIPLVVTTIYVEGDIDTPLGGGTNVPSAFSNWALWLNAGLDFRF